MAQFKQEKAGAERVRLAVTQRPWIMVACAAVVLLLAGAAWMGVRGATASEEFDIVRDDSGTAQDVRGDAAEGEPGRSAGGGDAKGASSGGASKEGGSPRQDGGDAAATVIVDVSGAVTAPAVVELPGDARVRDAIEAAGGLAPDADVSGVNRAARLTDGQQVYIPRVGEAAAGPATAPGTSGTGPATGASGSGAAASGAGLVNINTADAAALDALPGVGPSTAQAIIDEREANGAFSTPEDLMRVTGIGEKKFEKLRSSICV